MHFKYSETEKGEVEKSQKQQEQLHIFLSSKHQVPKSIAAENHKNVIPGVPELFTESDDKKSQEMQFTRMGNVERMLLRPPPRPRVPPKLGFKNEQNIITINTTADNLLSPGPILHQPKIAQCWKPEQENTLLSEASQETKFDDGSKPLNQDIGNRMDTMIFKTINGSLPVDSKEPAEQSGECTWSSCIPCCGECCIDILALI